MKPNDANGHLAPAERPLRVLLIAGSARRENNCPGRDSKARAFMMRMAEALPATWEIDCEDIGNEAGRPRIQGCNACVSTSMALCVWPCNCFWKGDHKTPDLMWEADLYARLDLADAWAIIGPVNWYGPSSNLKLMFDRLICMNGGNPREDLIGHKNADLAIRLERAAEWPALNINHLEGRSAGFFCYGDGGGDEVGADGRPNILRNKDYFDPVGEPFSDGGRNAFAPLVWQCRYSGIEVPDRLWRYVEFGVGRKYGENQIEHLAYDQATLAQFDSWIADFVQAVAAKGKVPPGRYRAFGYVPPKKNGDRSPSADRQDDPLDSFSSPAMEPSTP